MRHPRARRRFKLILISLFAICLILFFENRIEAFVPHLKAMAEQKAEQMLGERVRLSIGAIDGGILNGLVLNDIKIKDKKDAILFPSLVIDSIKTDYRIWDVFFKMKDGSLIPTFLPKDSCIYINFATKNREIAGFLRLEGDMLDSKVKGALTLFDSQRIDFSGSVKEDSFELDLWPKYGIVRMKGTLSDDGELNVNFKVNHLKLDGFDIVCDAFFKNRAGTLVEGEFETKNLILNYKPFLDLKTSYKIENRVLYLPSLKFGDDFKIQGKIALKKPYNIDIVLLADNANLGRTYSALNAGEAASLLSGTMNGRFEFKGPIENLALSARIEIRKGTIGGIDFDYLTASLKGDGPIIRIEDSRISRPSGYFALEGEMDLRRIGMNNFFEDVKMATDDAAIIWDSKEATKVGGGLRELVMKKKMSEEVNLGFKKFLNDDKVDESKRETDEVELEYKLHQHESLKVMIGQEGDFFGLEHKDRF